MVSRGLEGKIHEKRKRGIWGGEQEHREGVGDAENLS